MRPSVMSYLRRGARLLIALAQRVASRVQNVPSRPERSDVNSDVRQPMTVSATSEIPDDDAQYRADRDAAQQRAQDDGFGGGIGATSTFGNQQ